MTLADRVEQASGPDREMFLAAFYEISGSALQGTIALPYPEYAAVFGRFVELLDAEAYLDAAMTLLPEGWGVCIEQERSTRRCEASISPPGKEPWGADVFKGEGETLPLALLAATIRAHEQGGEGE